MEVDWDGAGRLIEYRMFLNGGYVGRDNPQWNGMQVTHHLATSRVESWATSTHDGEPIAWGYYGDTQHSVPGEGEIEGVEANCSPEEMTVSSSGCGAEGWNYAWRTGGLVAGLAGVAGASFTSGPNGGILTGVALYVMADQTRQWYHALRALHICRHGDGAGTLI
jgi:hypothetical protein